GYEGASILVVDGVPVDVAVRLRGMFQPIDGRYHWYGRIEANEELSARLAGGATVRLRTAHGEAAGQVSDPDPWGRYRIDGVGTPPFPVRTAL
ncbi:MAG: DUF4873 domain-containing protein, partial [Thermoleophilaceae bacterium]